MWSELVAGRDAWPSVQFGEVVKNNTRAIDPAENGIDKYVGLEHLDGGRLRIQRCGNTLDGTTFTRAFESGDVLFAKRRAYQRKAAIVGFSGVCSGDLLVFSPKGKSLAAEFLLLVVSCERFVDHAVNTSAGSLSPRTRWKDLARFRFRLPPIDIQRRIVDISNAALDQAGAFSVAAQRSLVVARTGLSADAESNIDWPRVRLADLFTRSPESGCSALETTRETGHFVLGLQALSPEGYVPGQFKPVDPTAKMLKARLEHGDLLVSRSNTRERVGFAAVFTERREDVSFPDTMMRLEVDTERLSKEFVAATLMSPHGRRHMMRFAAGTSASMKKINRKTLGEFEFPLPTISAQEQILKLYRQRAGAAARLRAVETQAMDVVSALRSGVLHDDV